MRKTVVIGIALIVANCCLAQDIVSYEGIWQEDNSNNFYSIHESGSKLVVIRLQAVEESGNTLESSYIGNKTDLVVTRVVPKAPAHDMYNQMQLYFQSPNKGWVAPVCAVCGVVPVHITKIF